MTLTAAGLFASPEHFLFAFDGGDAIFVPMDRTSYERSIFLDARIVPREAGRMRVQAAALAAHRAHQAITAPPTGWIFHVANCGSTLLARALDRRDASLVLREPMALRQLGIAAAHGRRDPDLLKLAVTLAGRRYRDDAPVIVKANVPVNFLAADILALAPDAPAILLHYPLEQYLLAILRSDNHRAWVMRVTDELGAIVDPGIAGLSVVERAAALWLAQIRIYDALLARHDRVFSLDADTLLDTPRPAIAAAAALFGVAMGEADLDAILAGDLFSTYAKNPDVAFDNDARHTRRSATKKAIAGDLVAARAWIHRRTAAAPLPERLAKPLVGDGAALLG